ncbi:hypothetical protein ACO0QE_000501 [Hanseniaspora vineae]
MKSVLVLPFDVEDQQKRTLSVIQLPNPSNTECKPPIDLLLSNRTEKDIQKQTVCQLKSHQFSKGTIHNKFKDRENYYYKDGSIPLKSLIIHNSEDMHEGELSSNGELKIALKYDLTFSLIGALVSIATKRAKHSAKNTAKTENDYYRSNGSGLLKEEKEDEEELFSGKVLPYVDLHESLIYNHDPQWEHISQDLLISKMRNVSEVIVESDEEYFKISKSKIVDFVLEKINRLVLKFPQSIETRFLSDISDKDVLTCGKKLYALNLLVSVLPVQVYNIVYSALGDDIDKYTLYLKEKQEKLDKELSGNGEFDKKLLLQQAMTVGVIGGGSNSMSMTVKKTTSVGKKSVPAKRKSTSITSTTVKKPSRGAIDGFFKKKH